MGYMNIPVRACAGEPRAGLSQLALQTKLKPHKARLKSQDMGWCGWCGNGAPELDCSVLLMLDPECYFRNNVGPVVCIKEVSGWRLDWYVAVGIAKSSSVPRDQGHECITRLLLRVEVILRESQRELFYTASGLIFSSLKHYQQPKNYCLRV